MLTVALKILKLTVSKITGFSVLLSFVVIPVAVAQKPTKVKIIRADDLKAGRQGKDKIQRLIGNVILLHDSTYLYCDSAHLNEKKNSFDGYGNIHIKVSDTLNIYSEILNYNGDNKIAELHHNVRLIDNRSQLYTDHLWYDRTNRYAWYLTGGEIIDTANTLVSKKGYYYTDSKEAVFSDSVVLTNARYVMESDSLKYLTESEISYFYGPTTITSDSNLVYCENGWYNTKTDKSFFSKNAYIITKEQKLSGDTLYYDRNTDFGLAYGNVSLLDTVQKMLISGNYGEFKKKAGFSFVTDSARAVMIDKKDSLFLHSDTLWIHFDSAQNPEYMLAYHKMKFFRNDMQGMCDSLVYSFADSTIFLYKSPVLWSEQNQLTADSIRIALSNNQIDTLALINSAFIISVDDSIRKTYNQIKGRVLVAYFKNNMMKVIKIWGNSESLYFVRDEYKRLVGINKSLSSDMRIYLDSNQIKVITPIQDVDSHMYPPEGELQDEDLLLKNFIWIEGKRPMKKEDIFVW
jgi:lipopolysaccharide export system protein LptA